MFFFLLNRCPKLKKLALPEIAKEDEERFSEAISKWEELQVLEMESKPSSFPELAKRIGSHCSGFRGLKLRGSITEEDADSIVGCLPNLRWLDLSLCRFGRGELVVMVEGLKGLERLSVRDCVGFEVDEEVERRARGIEVFEHEGCVVEDDCELEEEVGEEDDDDGDFSLQQMMMYYGDCYAMWLY